MPHLKVLTGPSKESYYFKHSLGHSLPIVLQEDWQVQAIKALMPHLPEDFINQDFKIAEPYEDFNKKDSRKGFKAKKFWEIEPEKQTYNVYQIFNRYICIA